MQITEQEVKLVQEINETVNKLNLLLSKASSLSLKVVHDINVLEITRIRDRNPREIVDFSIKIYKEIND